MSDHADMSKRAERCVGHGGQEIALVAADVLALMAELAEAGAQIAELERLCDDANESFYAQADLRHVAETRVAFLVAEAHGWQPKLFAAEVEVAQLKAEMLDKDRLCDRWASESQANLRGWNAATERAEAAEADNARLRKIIQAKNDLLMAHRTGNLRLADRAIGRLDALAKEEV